MAAYEIAMVFFFWMQDEYPVLNICRKDIRQNRELLRSKAFRPCVWGDPRLTEQLGASFL